jgi:hypothetical protein
MFVLTVEIAEHVVRFSTHSLMIHNFIFSKYGNARMKESAEKQTDLSIRVEQGFGVPFVDYKVDIMMEERQIVYRRADYCIEVDPDYRTALIKVYDDFALKHALLNLYSAFITHHQWGLLIHSSCVVDQGIAYLFAGRSGAGKSTIARLSAPREILSDEASIVKIGSNEAMVFNSPFRSDTEMPYDNGHYPLAAIQILHQSLENKRSRIEMMNGIMEVLNKVFYWAYHPDQTVKVLRICHQLVSCIPVYELYFQKNNVFWEQIHAHKTIS